MSVPVAPDIAQEAKRIRARADLDRVRLLRLVARMLDNGNSQQTIAATLEISQPTVSRMARQIRAGLPVHEVTAEEVINLYVAGEIDEDDMLDRVLDMRLTLGAYDPTGGDGYVRGTWDDVASAVGRGLITDEQYNLLATKATTVPR